MATNKTLRISDDDFISFLLEPPPERPKFKLMPEPQKINDFLPKSEYHVAKNCKKLTCVIDGVEVWSEQGSVARVMQLAVSFDTKGETVVHE